LIDGCRPLQIARNKQRRFALLFQIQSKFCRRARFAGTMQAYHHDPSRLGQIERLVAATQQLG
jgi:hypothetical protein